MESAGRERKAEGRSGIVECDERVPLQTAL